MAAASFVAVTQLATRANLGARHLWAVGLYAIALPSLVMVAIVLRRETTGMANEWWSVVRAMALIGGGLFVAGTVSMFWSIDGVIARAFVVSIVLTFILMAHPLNQRK